MSDSDESLTKKTAVAIARDWIDGRLPKPRERYRWSQMRWLMDQLAVGCIEESLRLNENEDELCERLYRSHEIISGAWDSAAPSYARDYLTPEQTEALEPAELQKIDLAKHRLWQRHDVKRAFSEGTRSDQYPDIRKDSLTDAMTNYLKMPYLRSPVLDWIFLDMSISGEISEFGEFLKQQMLPGKRDFLGMHERYITARGNLSEMTKINWRETLERLNAWFWGALGLPIAAIWASFYWRQIALGRWLLGIYVTIVLLFLCYRIIAWAIKIFRKIRGIVDPRLKAFMLWDEMYEVWRRLEGPVVNPTRVREAMVTSADKGAVWSNAVWSLIDRVIAHDPAVWIVQPTPN